MSWHAVRAVRGAAAAARSFFIAAERGRWARLAVLAFVVGVGWLTPLLAGVTVPTSLDTRVGGIPGHFVAVGVGLGVLSGVVADAYGRFALVSAMRSGRLRLTEDIRWRLGRAVRWAGFAASAGVLVAAASGVALRALRAGWLATTGGDPSGAVDIAVTLGVGLLAGTVVVGFVGFAHATLSLLPATMLATGVGALASWRRLWRAFAGRRGGFLGYLLVRGLVVLAVTAFALLAVGTLVAGLSIAAFVVTVGVFGTVSDAVTTIGVLPSGAVAAFAVLAFAVLPVRAVAVTYLVGYDLAVLGAVDPDLALVDVPGADSHAADDAVSVVLPDGTEAGLGEVSAGVEAEKSADDATGAFKFGAVEAEEE